MIVNNRRTLLVLALLVLVMLVTVLLPVSADVTTPPDPGGIGITNLTAWFEAGSGIFGDVACNSAATAGGTVACWKDQGPNGLEAKQNGVGKRASWEINQLNGLPVVRFDSPPSNNDDLGTGSDSIDSLSTAFPTTDATIFVVQKTSVVQQQSSFATSPVQATNNFGVRIPWDDNAVYWDMGDKDTTGNGRLSYSSFSDTETFYLWGFETDAGTGQAIYLNGEAKASDNTADTFDPAGKELFVGAASTAKERFSGDIAELIIYNVALSDLDRTHVELYLRDKYDLDLSDSSTYSAPEETYNHNVRGISKSAQVFDSDRGSDTAGLRVENNSFLQEADDALVFGHNNAPFNCCVTGNLGSSAANRRWARLWSFDVNDALPTQGGWVDLTFDISDAGGSGTFATGGNYYLLKRGTASSDDFTDVDLVNTTISDDMKKITFRVLVTNLGSEFTLGAFNSPTAVELGSVNITGSSMPDVILGVLALLVLFTLILLFRRTNEAS